MSGQFEFLIVRDVDDVEQMKVVGMLGLFLEVEMATNDDSYCFTAYEIHDIFVDFSLPREKEA